MPPASLLPEQLPGAEHTGPQGAAPAPLSWRPHSTDIQACWHVAVHSAWLQICSRETRRGVVWHQGSSGGPGQGLPWHERSSQQRCVIHCPAPCEVGCCQHEGYWQPAAVMWNPVQKPVATDRACVFMGSGTGRQGGMGWLWVQHGRAHTDVHIRTYLHKGMCSHVHIHACTHTA